LDLRLLTAALTQVVELGAAHVAPAHHLDLVQRGAVDRVGPLDPHPEADLADGERLPRTGPLAPDHDAVEDLDPGAVALDDPCVHLERVTGPEVRDVGPHRLGVERVQRVHRCCPSRLKAHRPSMRGWMGAWPYATHGNFSTLPHAAWAA